MSDILLSGLLADCAKTLFPKAKMEWVDAKGFEFQTDIFGMSVLEAASAQNARLLRVSRLDENDRTRLAQIEAAYDLARDDVEFSKDGGMQILAMPSSLRAAQKPQGDASEVLKSVVAAANGGLARAVVLGEEFRLAAKDLAAQDERNREHTHHGDQKEFDALDQQVIERGFYNLDRFSFRYKRFDGKISDTVHRDLLVTGDAVVVLPYDPVRDEVVLIEQMRPAALARGSWDAWGLEAVAGLIGPQESPEYTARRELEEEAGLEALALYPLAPSYQSPGSISQFMYPFIARVDLSSYQAGIFGLDEEQEDIRSHILPRKDAIALLKTGEANNAPLQIVLYALALNLREISETLLAQSGKGE